MFIANSKRTLAEVRGLNSPAGTSMVPAVPLSPYDPQDPAHLATIASGTENALTTDCQYSQPAIVKTGA